MNKLNFKSFLLEETVNGKLPTRTPLEFNSVEELYSQLLDGYDTALNAFINRKIQISRGSNQKPGAYFADYSVGERKAQNTTDYYRALLDSAPSFSDFPKRNRSLIATTDRAYASGFGENNSLVLPHDDVMIAVAPENDIWDTWVPLFGSEFKIFEISKLFDNAFTAYDINLNGDVMSLDQIIKAVDDITIEKFFEVVSKTNGTMKFFEKIRNVYQLKQQYGIRDGKSLVDYIHGALNARELGFDLQTTTEFYKNPPMMAHEVWFSGKCVLISYSIIMTHFSKLSELAKK